MQETLTSVLEPVELDGPIAIKGNLEINKSKVKLEGGARLMDI